MDLLNCYIVEGDCNGHAKRVLLKYNIELNIQAFFRLSHKNNSQHKPQTQIADKEPEGY